MGLISRDMQREFEGVFTEPLTVLRQGRFIICTRCDDAGAAQAAVRAVRKAGGM